MGVATGALGSYIAEKKGRAHRFGFVIGFLFGLVGVLGLLLIPKKPKSDETNDSLK
jgi:hypothetical protein